MDTNLNTVESLSAKIDSLRAEYKTKSIFNLAYLDHLKSEAIARHPVRQEFYVDLIELPHFLLDKFNAGFSYEPDGYSLNALGSNGLAWISLIRPKDVLEQEHIAITNQIESDYRASIAEHSENLIIEIADTQLQIEELLESQKAQEKRSKKLEIQINKVRDSLSRNSDTTGTTEVIDND